MDNLKKVTHKILLEYREMVLDGLPEKERKFINKHGIKRVNFHTNASNNVLRLFYVDSGGNIVKGNYLDLTDVTMDLYYQHKNDVNKCHDLAKESKTLLTQKLKDSGIPQTNMDKVNIIRKEVQNEMKSKYGDTKYCRALIGIHNFIKSTQ